MTRPAARLARAAVSGALAALAVLAPPLAAQQAAELAFRDEAMRHFEASSRKMLMLSEAVPADLYDWQPSDEVFTVARVYAHIARYNYLYLTENLGVAPPQGVDWRDLESLTDKYAVRQALMASVDHVREAVAAMDADDLSRTVRLYGRDVPAWAVLFQLVSHMNEHVGQAIAYARSNEIVPPWSR